MDHSKCLSLMAFRTTRAMFNLADVHSAQGHRQALYLHLQGLQMHRNVLGNHYQTVGSYYNVGGSSQLDDDLKNSRWAQVDIFSKE